MKTYSKRAFAVLTVFATFLGIFLGVIELQEFIRGDVYQGSLNTYPGDTTIIFGNNRFIGTPALLVVGDTPLFTARISDGTLFVSLLIFDKDGKIVAKIEDNEWVVNPNNYFTLESTSTRITVRNQYDELALDAIANPDGSVKVNGVFYREGTKVVANDTGLFIDGPSMLVVG